MRLHANTPKHAETGRFRRQIDFSDAIRKIECSV